MNIKIGNLFKGDKVIWMVLLFLCMISIVEVFSASSTLTYKSQDYLGPIIGHSWKILVGVGTAILILNIPCRFFKLMTPALLLISGIMLFWVLFFGEKEELEIRHRADDREIFARGAMRALAFAANAKPGLYNMEDVLFGGTAQ
jgi:cell division protein FtsW (lipid II flippase)